MRYLINESQLNDSTIKQLEDAIKRQLDNIFDRANINVIHPYEYNDDTGEEWEDTEKKQFYVGDYHDNDNVFEWYGKDYWGGNPDMYIGYISNSPIVDIEEPYHSKLNNLFGNLWYKPFKEWFMENFEIPVKSVMDEIRN